MRERRPTDRADAVLRLPASTLVLVLYQRIGAFTALRRACALSAVDDPGLRSSCSPTSSDPDMKLYDTALETFARSRVGGWTFVNVFNHVAVRSRAS